MAKRRTFDEVDPNEQKASAEMGFSSDQQDLSVECEPPSPPVHENERRLGLSMLMKVALAAVVISSLVISISCVMRANQLEKQSRELEQQLDEYNEKIKRLVYYINKEVDDEYIIEYAREYLDLYFPDEDIYYNDVNE